MGLGTESEIRGFVSGMDGLDEAVRMMTAMLNRFNKADVFIGADHDGQVIGIEASDSDVQAVMDRMKEKVNHLPEVSVTVESDPEGRRYIHISATGYETPYSFGSWFYVRRYRYSDDDGPVRIVWTENLTCGMKRHRRGSPVWQYKYLCVQKDTAVT